MSNDPLDPLDVDLDKPAPEDPRDLGPRRRKILVMGVAAGLVLALVLGYLYLRAPSRQPTAAAVAPSAQPKTTPQGGAEPGEQIPLPPLDETDALVRQLIAQLSSHPTVAAWLTTDGLILNFAVVTRQISNGESPTQELGAIGPVPPFRTRTLRGDLFVDPSSYRRYDRYAQAVSSIDARGAARLYATLEPRVLDAYRRMGEPTADFDPVLERAIVELLSVPAVQGEIELAPSGIVYAFVDPRLEKMSAAQKHLLRMGPENVQIIQAKLREIADYLGIPAVRLPRPSILRLDE
jgi:hypothetical protein